MQKTILSSILLASLACSAGALEVKLTVSEPVGAARTNEPVSAGVCFKPGEVKDLGKLALFTKSGQAVPCQFSPLVKLEDGSYQWVLADFQCSVAAKGKAEYIVKTGTAAKPAKPVIASEAGGKYTFKNGVLEFTVDANKPAFEIFSELKAGGKTVIKGLGKEAMTVRDALDKNKLYRAGRAAKAGWDYKGPMRSTLMIEGPYVDDGGREWLAWRVRVTCYAGSSLVRVEHSLRNSCATHVRHTKIKDAYLRLGLQGGASAGKTSKDHLVAGNVFAKHRLLSGYFSPSLHELSATGGKLKLGVVPLYEGKWNPRTHRGYNPNEGGSYNPGDTGSWWLYDCTYKIDEYWLSFSPSTSSGQAAANLAKGLDAKLYGLCPGEYYAECEALGFGKFGTVADEAATYKKWGWKNIEAKKARLLAGKWMKPMPGYHVAYVLSHADSETDDAEGMLLMGLRSGGRGYFDAGLAWARFYANNHVSRIDYTPKGRRKYDRWKFKGHDVHIMTSHQSYSNGKTCGCHFYGGGAMDYYVLTGEKSILVGARDIYGYVRRKWAKHTPGKSRVGSYGTRGFGRQFMGAIRYYEITREAEVKKFVDKMAQLALKEPSYVKEEDYGFIDAPSSNGMHGKKMVTKYLAKLPRLQEYMKKKGLTWDQKTCTVKNADGKSWKVYDAAGTWEQTYVHQAMERYWRATGKKNKEAEEYITRFANYFRKFPWDDHCQQVGYIAWGLHFPEKGMCLGCQTGRWSEAHDKCPGPGAKHSGWYTRFGPDVAARAYLVTGKKKYLEQAKMYWNRGSKRGYQRTKQSAADDEVGNFATHVPPKDDSILSTGLMFYLVPRAK